MSDENKLVSPQEAELKKVQQELTFIQQQRKSAIDALKRRVVSLMDDKLAHPSVASQKEVSLGLDATLRALEAHDRFLDMVTHDMIGIVGTLDEVGKVVAQNAAQCTTLIQLLKTRGFTTEQELQATYDALLKSQTPPSQG